MNIMISNDDGILAPGIAALIRAFAKTGHDIYVCAPDSQRSAASHSLSIHKALCVKETAIKGAAGAWAIGGTPVDCVKLGARKLCPQADFVVSGVNHGYNAGSDILYSGTVGAAMEGVFNGLPAMAVSLAYEREDTYDKAAELAVQLFEKLQQHPLAKGTLLNVNYPATDGIKGVMATGMTQILYNEEYREVVLEDGTIAYALHGEVDKMQEMADDDYSWLRKGYATATVLTFDMTDKKATQAIKSWL